MKQIKFHFHNRSGVRLAALLDLPMSSTPTAYALFAHCFTCSKNLSAVSRISRTLAEHSVALMRFDFTGLGESGGNFSDTSFSTNVTDIVDAANYLSAGYGPPQLMIGHSMGGTAALCAAGALPDTKAVAVIGSPSGPDHVLKHFEGELAQIMDKGEADVLISGKKMNISRTFVQAAQKVKMEEVFENLKKAVLILHSPLDEVVGIEHAGRLFMMARHPKSFVSLDRADHLLTHKEDAQYAGNMIAAWASRYLYSYAGD